VTTSALPVVRVLARLARWEVLRLPSAGGEELVRIAGFPREPDHITLSYRCAPCLFGSLLPGQDRGRGHPSRPAGPARQILHRALRPGTRLVIRTAQPRHRARFYLYTLRAHGAIDGPHECAEHPKAPLAPRCPS
jgi:hypothetical protein